MTIKKIIVRKILFIVVIAFTFSCQKAETNKPITKTVIQKKYLLPNDEFRERIIPNIKKSKDVKKLETLLDSLDKRKLSFCEFVQQEFKLDDSCYDVAKKQFPLPEDQEKFVKVHNDVYDIAQKRFLQKTKMTEKNSDYLIIVYSFDKNVKNFCGKF
jgi:hypothetical protein